MRRVAARRRSAWLLCGLCVVGLGSAALALGRADGEQTPAPTPPMVHQSDHGAGGHPSRPTGPRGTVTLAFAGDVHFQLHLAALLEHPRGALGPITRTLAAADLTMVNLESSITDRGVRLHEDFAFRTEPAALDVLADAGVDVVTLANNHAVDYGPVGLADTLRAVEHSPVPVVGIGGNRSAAFTPYRVTVHGTDISFLAASSVPDQLARSAARSHRAGIAAAFNAHPRHLIAAVRREARRADVVVVYLHWGTEKQSRPDRKQRATAQALAEAGADVVVGSHAHVLLGSGWLGETYVDYGLGNFVWYHNHDPETGVLRLTIRDGEVVRDSWAPARIRTYGRPSPLRGADRAEAIADWRRLHRSTGLANDRGEAPLPAYSWSVRRVGPLLRQRLRSSHHPGCPVPLTDLRYLQLTYVGFDGHAHTGEMVVHRDYAAAVAGAFGRLYDVRWPIRRMHLVDDYGGNDNRSMAANNTSGFNCRSVAGKQAWSAHAYGAAVDINPVQNPDLTNAPIAPDAGRRFAAADRSADANPPPGLITANGPVVRAFTRIGWEWGGTWSAKDYQHFSAPRGDD